MKKLLFTFFILLAPTLASAATLGKVNSNNIGLVGWWTFDGADMVPIVRDKSGNSDDGLLQNFNSTTTSPGRIGQALKFDGINDGVQINNESNFDLTTNITVSAWIKTNPLLSTSFFAPIVSKGDSSWRLQQNGNGNDISFDTTNSASNNGLASNVNINDAQWHHVVGTYNGTTKIIYVDGIRANSNTPGLAIDTNNIAVAIGKNNEQAGRFWNGSLDDVRVYNRALSAAEVAALYNSGSAGVARSSVGSTTAPLSSGLVGYWTLDGSKTNWATGRTLDSAGSNTGQLQSMATSTTPAIGKIGQAFVFDGVNDRVDAGTALVDLQAGTTTLAFWMNKATTTAESTVISNSDGNTVGAGWFLVYNYTGAGGVGLILTFECTGTNFRSKIPFPSDDVWHHMVVSWNATTTCPGAAKDVEFWVDGVQQTTELGGGGAGTHQTDATDHFFIGCRGNTACNGSFFKGMLDDVRVYNRRLTRTEISDLYNSGQPKIAQSPAVGSTAPLGSGLVGYWTMDGSKTNWTTGKILDSSGSGNTGQLISMSTSTTPAFGKVGQAFNFNGSSSLVNLGDVLNNTFPISFSMWVNPTARGTFGGIFATDRTLDFSNYIGAWVQYDNTGTVSLTYGDNTGCSTANRRTKGSANTVLPLNQWTHITGVIRGPTDMSIYINGVDDGGVYSGGGGSMVSNSNVAFIGAMSDCAGPPKFYFPGKLDDVRVYNRALSAQEVQQLYNMSK